MSNPAMPLSEHHASIADSPLAVTELPVLLKWLKDNGDYRHGIIHRAVQDFQQERASFADRVKQAQGGIAR